MFTQEPAMRTYDKLIATIPAGQGSRGLRSSFGMHPAPGLRMARAAGATSQDTA
jgi:hypothetical protein